MTTLRISLIAATLTCLFTSGCIASEEGVDTNLTGNEAGDETSNEAVERPLSPGDQNGIITGNGALILTPEILAVYAPLAKVLTLTSLTDISIQANELVTTAHGRTFLDYVIKCALPHGQSRTVNYLGVQYTFQGHVGLAPEWGTEPLSTTGRRWLSACLLAHLNATATVVTILLRGDHPALSHSAGEDSTDFTLREGAFYGDIFGTLPAKYACTGVGSIPSRVCANGTLGVSLCGLMVPGDCRGTDKACEGLTADGIYDTCHSGFILPLVPTTAYPETVTVYLKP